jgi:nucleoside-diphosphate-sugar epimerase
VVLTGSVFENDEGAGSGTLEAFSPYGLSKGLTWQMFRYYAQPRQISLGKFVIANPFGPYEEPRFIHYLIKNWFAGAKPSVNTPSYIRDNIHVSLLAKAYVHFAAMLADGISRMNPSGYIESQGSFAHRLASEMRERLGLKCEYVLKEQSDFSEPRIRINTDVADTKALGWSEKTAWDELADYYTRLMKI